jgi:hypothetical protein
MDEQLTKIKVWITFLNNVVDKGYNNDNIMLNTLVEYLDNYNFITTTSDNDVNSSDDDSHIHTMKSSKYNYSNNDSDCDSMEDDGPFIFEHNRDTSNMQRCENLDNIKELYPSYKLKDLKIEPYISSSPVEHIQKPICNLVPNVVREQQKIDKFLNNTFKDNMSSFYFYSAKGIKPIDRMNKFIKSTKFIL